MMDRKNYRQRRIGRFEFRDEPRTLSVTDLATFRTIAVHAYDRQQWRGECPEHIRLRHRAARRITVVGTDDRRLGTKVANKGLQARFARGRIYIAIMVAGDGYDRSVIIEIGLVKLRPVVCAFSVVIDDIAQVIEKRGPFRGLAVDHIAFHESRYTFDVRRSVHAAGIADGMKHELSAVCDACHLASLRSVATASVIQRYRGSNERSGL